MRLPPATTARPRARSFVTSLGALFALAACSSGPSAAAEGEATARVDEPAHAAPERASDPPPAETSRAGSGAASAPPSAPLVDLPVAEDRAMATLSETESTALCAWLATNVPRRSVECEDGPTFEVGVGPDDGCPPAAAFAGCPLTAGETARCMRDNAADPCAHGMFGADACRSFRECMLLQMGAVREGPAPPE